MIDPALRRSMRPPRSWSLAALDSRRVHVERVERRARRHEEPIALESPEAEVGAALGERDVPDELGGRVEDRHAVQAFAAAPAAPEVAVDVAAHAVRNAVSAIDEHPAVGEARPADDVEHPDLARYRATDDDVELRLVRAEAEAIGPWNVAGGDGHLARPDVGSIDVGRQLRRRHVALVVAEDPEGRIAEPDGPVRLADDI